MTGPMRGHPLVQCTVHRIWFEQPKGCPVCGVETKLAGCREENEELKARITELRARIAELETEVQK